MVVLEALQLPIPESLTERGDEHSFDPVSKISQMEMKLALSVICTTHMTPPTQPKKCAASSNGAEIPLRNTVSQPPNEKPRVASIQNVEKLVRWGLNCLMDALREEEIRFDRYENFIRRLVFGASTYRAWCTKPGCVYQLTRRSDMSSLTLAAYKLSIASYISIS